MHYAATLEAARGTFERWTETVRSEVAELAGVATALLHRADPNAADFGSG